MTIKTSIPHSPYFPFDENVSIYNTSFGQAMPWEYAGWKQETLSWKEGVYLHAGLNPNFRCRLAGPDALQLLKDSCINYFGKFSIGCSKHGIMCNENGNIMADGLIWRLGEDEFVCMGHGPYLDYLVASGRYDVTCESLDDTTFLFQIAGPRSLDVMEALLGESLRDLEFFWHKAAVIPQKGWLTRNLKVRIYRVGVARTLAYEVHGDTADVEAVYQAIMEAGAPFGIQRLGLQAYGMNHTEGGMVQAYIHFAPAWKEDEAFMANLPEEYNVILEDVRGSAGPDLSKRYGNPVELGWGHMIGFDHEFTGSAALKRSLENQKRKTVTLEWNTEDVLSIYASQFRRGEDHEFMDFAANQVWQGFMSMTFCDDILVGNEVVGMSSGRMFSYYYGKMISLGVLQTDLAVEGNEVEVLWGSPGTRQKRVRATVARFPYIDLPFNNDIDVKSLP